MSQKKLFSLLAYSLGNHATDGVRQMVLDSQELGWQFWLRHTAQMTLNESFSLSKELKRGLLTSMRPRVPRGLNKIRY